VMWRTSTTRRKICGAVTGNPFDLYTVAASRTIQNDWRIDYGKAD